MSGIITNPYFKEFFHHPTSYEIGTMVVGIRVLQGSMYAVSQAHASSLCRPF